MSDPAEYAVVEFPRVNVVVPDDYPRTELGDIDALAETIARRAAALEQLHEPADI